MHRHTFKVTNMGSEDGGPRVDFIEGELLGWITDGWASAMGDVTNGPRLPRRDGDDDDEDEEEEDCARPNMCHVQLAASVEPGKDAGAHTAGERVWTEMVNVYVSPPKIEGCG